MTEEYFLGKSDFTAILEVVFRERKSLLRYKCSRLGLLSLRLSKPLNACAEVAKKRYTCISFSLQNASVD